ncbi:MAG: hypothetical protein ACPLRA_00110, partial [Candidatus Saccharicenans sp.]
MRSKNKNEILKSEKRKQGYLESISPKTEEIKPMLTGNRVIKAVRLSREDFGYKKDEAGLRKFTEKKIETARDSRSTKKGRNSVKSFLPWSSSITSFTKIQRISLIIFAILISFLIAFPVSAISNSSYLTSPPSTEQQKVGSQNSLEQLDQVLKALEKFDHSQGEGPALALERLIFSLKDDRELRPEAEKKLLQFFAGPITSEARIAISKPLSWIAGSESVRALSPDLLDPEKSDAARYVLERIPGDDADSALVAA